MKISRILSSLLVISTLLILTTVSGPISNETISPAEPSASPLKNVSEKPLVILLWCPNPQKVSCSSISSEAMKWRQLSQSTRSVVAAAIGGGVGAALGGGVGGGIGSLTFIPLVTGPIAGGGGAALGGGIGGSLGGGEGGAIGGALGGAIGGGVGGLLGAPGAAVGGLALGSLGAGLGSYYISNATLPNVIGRINATLVPISNYAGQALNSTWNSFLSDVLLIGPEEDILTLLEDYEEDLLEVNDYSVQ